MLVLSRKKNESIVINGNIRIEVLQIKGKQIRLGITAPSNLKVLRGELPRHTSPLAEDSDGPEPESSARTTQIVDCDIQNLASAMMTSI